MIIEDKEYNVINLVDDDLSLNNISSLKKNIEELLSSGSINIVFDLSQMNSITSSGLGVLIGILNRIKTNNGSLKLMNLSARILNIFQITKLNLVFDIIS